MSEERPNKCPNCEAPVVWCACIVKSCPICNTIPKVGGGMIVHPLCDCFDEKYIEFDAWQSRPIEDELRAEIARLKSSVELFASQLSAWGFDTAAEEIVDEILGGKVNAPNYHEIVAELARRDGDNTILREQVTVLNRMRQCDAEELANWQEQSQMDINNYKYEIARRDDLIRRLKEDAERLATGYEQISREAVPYCVVCKKDAFSGYLGQIKHDDWCPIILHRALMKELE